MEAAEVDDEVLSRILTLARRTYDFVIVDTFPMLDRAMVAVLDLSDRAYVVLENVVPTLLGGVKFVEALQGLGVSRERQRIVLNRHTSLPGSVTPADAAERLGRDVDHVIPFDKAVVVAANTGEPCILRPAPVVRLRPVAPGAGRRHRRDGRRGKDAAASARRGAKRPSAAGPGASGGIGQGESAVNDQTARKNRHDSEAGPAAAALEVEP